MTALIKRLTILYCCLMVLVGCGSTTGNHDRTEQSQYMLFLKAVDESPRYKELTANACSKYPQAKIDIAVICNNLNVLNDLPDEKINEFFFPYLQKHVEAKHLDELIRFYDQEEIKITRKKIRQDIEKGTNNTSSAELEKYNSINNTEAGKQYFRYIEHPKRYDEADEYVEKLILEELKKR